MFCCVASADLYAQDSATDKLSPTNNSSAAVTVAFTVSSGEKTNFVSLLPQDFSVAVDDKFTFPLTSLNNATQPVDFLFLLDSSGSARDVITQQSEAALTLFDYFRGQNPRIGVIGFNERAGQIAPLTDDRKRVRQAFQSLTAQISRTAIFVAADAALDLFAEQTPAPQTPSRRRIIILISDGLNTAGNLAAQQVIMRAKQQNIVFYVVQFPLYEPRDGKLAARPPSKGVRELATLTGGKFFRIGTAKNALDPRAEYDLRPVLRAIADDLNGAFYAQFVPSAALRDGKLHRVQLRLTSGAKRHVYKLRQFDEDFILQP